MFSCELSQSLQAAAQAVKKGTQAVGKMAGNLGKMGMSSSAQNIVVKNQNTLNVNNNFDNQQTFKQPVLKIPGNLGVKLQPQPIQDQAKSLAKNPEMFPGIFNVVSKLNEIKFREYFPKSKQIDISVEQNDSAKQSIKVAASKEDHIQPTFQEKTSTSLLKKEIADNLPESSDLQIDHSSTILDTLTDQKEKQSDVVDDRLEIEPTITVDAEQVIMPTYQDIIEPKGFISSQDMNITYHPQDQQYDFEQMYIDSMLRSLSKIIDTWIDENRGATNNIYIQANLEQQIFDAVFTKTQDGKVYLVHPEADLIIIEKLLEKYKNNEDVVDVLHTIKTNIDEYIISQKPVVKKANDLVNFYYQEMARDVLTFMKVEPYFDKGQITNIPEIKAIIKESQLHPTLQALKALQASYKAIDRAIFNAQQNNNNALIEQLIIFKENISVALQNPRLSQVQSLGQRAASFGII